MSHIIFHIDVNSAYLSWTAVEQLKNGADVDIRTIPAIIGGDRESRHGIVLAKSPSAKKFGIRTGEPVVNAFRKCPNLHMDPPNHRMYREYSRRLMDFLKTYTPEIEQVSVDECYMDFTGIAQRFSSPVEAAYEIKARVYEKFGFTVNVGISTNKLLAKMASDFEKPNRVHTLFPEEVKEKLADLRLELAKAKADRKELEADMQAKEKVSKEKSEKLDALEEQVARLTSMSPDDRVTARNEANAQARADVDSECQAVFVAVMGLASRCAAVMQDERSTDETCMWIHKRVSVLANSVAEALLGAGIDVDLRAYLELPQDDGTDMNDNRE